MATNSYQAESSWEKGERGEARAEHLLRGCNCYFIRLSRGEGPTLIQGPDGEKLICPDLLKLPYPELLEIKNREYAREWEDENGTVVDERVYIKKRVMEDYVTIASNLIDVKIGIYLESSHRYLMADVARLAGSRCDKGIIDGETVYWYSVDDFRTTL